MANSITMKVTYSSFKGYRDGVDVASIDLKFPRIASRAKLAEVVADLAIRSASFTYDASVDAYSARGPEIRFGWGAPPVEELADLIASHGFYVERDFEVFDGHKNVTDAVKAGTYEPEKEEKTTQPAKEKTEMPF